MGLFPERIVRALSPIRRLTRRLVVSGVVSLVVAVASPAVAARRAKSDVSSADKEKKQLEVARGHLKKAKTSFALGEYEKAAKEWTYAYKIRPEPELLFNIAQAHRLAGNRDKARTLYESYLREAPNAANREEVRRFMDELSKEPEVTPASDAPPKKKRSRKKKTEPSEP